jgi:SAM-dependent methyltransferase
MEAETTPRSSAQASAAAAAEAFSGAMVTALNQSMLGLLISVGHKTGLFDTMSDLPPSSSGAIARAAGLNERYVREWLAGMATGKIVTYRPDPGTFHLPAASAASLTRAAGSGNLAVYFQYLALLGKVEDDIVTCFREGGGVPYSAYPEFQELMAEESAQVFDGTLIDQTLPLVPGLVEALQAGIDVCDIGCGRGHAICLMARAFPASRFVGYDFSEDAIAAARAEASAAGLDNAVFEARNVGHLGAGPQFDFVTAFDCIHDQAHPAAVLKGVASVLRAGGRFLMVDIAAHSELAHNLDHPFGPCLYATSCMHCMTVSLAQDGDGLGNMWGEQKARQMLADAGFGSVVVHRVPGDILNGYFVATRT